MEPLDAVEIVSFTTLYPNAAQPNHGVFVENRLRHLVASGQVHTRILAPSPWFPVGATLLPRYTHFARVPDHEARHGLEILHPRFVTIPKLGMSAAPALLYAGALPALRQMQRDRDFALIDAHYFYPDGVAAAWLGRKLGKPVVITARGTDINLIPRFALPRKMIQNAAAAAAGIIAVSQALKDAMVELGVAADKITVLRNGVDLELFHPRGREEARAKFGLTRRTLVSVGLLIERKGHELIIGALPDLPDTELLIAGDGEEREKLKALAVKLGVGARVRFLGSVPHRELQKLYVAADALVLASSREGWPNVLLEAMACGTPVVASNIWGNPEVVATPDAGVLMAARTSAGVADAVKTLFTQLPERARTRAFAERHSWEATTRGQIDLFRHILRARRAPQARAVAAISGAS
jgi:glycosyltransferase involved in cell wall biosynthesis